MADSNLPQDTQAALLKLYEPVLRFSAGESFFPMAVDWFVANCMLKKSRRWWPDKKIRDFPAPTTDEAETTTDEAARKYVPKITINQEEANNHLKDLSERWADDRFGLDGKPRQSGEKGRDDYEHYLRFVPRRPAGASLVLFGLLLVHALVIAIGMNANNLGIIGVALGADCDFAPIEPAVPVVPAIGLFIKPQLLLQNAVALFKPGCDYASIAILTLVIVSWPLLETIRRGHFAVLINLFAVLFFGTLQGTGFGLLVTVSALLAGAALLVFFARRSGMKLLALLPMVVVPLVIFFLLIVSGWVSLVIAVAITFVLLLVWTRIGRLRGNQWRLGSLGRSIAPDQRNRIYVMLLSAGLMTATWLAGRWLKLHVTPEGRSTLSILLILQAAVAGFWFFLHPLDLVKRDHKIETDNSYTYTIGWNFRVIVTVFITAGLWTVGSTVAQLNNLPQLGWLFFVTNVVGTLLVLGTDVARFGIDLLSRQPDSDADRAGRRYRDIMRWLDAEAKSNDQTHKRHVYYGRASQREGWVVLQYFYFYAFNNWRRAADGVNHHEADWEAVSVFLRCASREPSMPEKGEEEEEEEVAYLKRMREYAEAHLEPFGVAYSQHNEGLFCFWDAPPGVDEKNPKEADRVVSKVTVIGSDGRGNSTTHPLVYPALGSHANYHLPDLYSASVHTHGFLRGVTVWADRFLSRFRRPPPIHWVPAVRRAQALVAQRGKGRSESADGGSPCSGESPSTKVEWTRDPPGALPIEYAAGDGLRVGPYEDSYDLASEFRWSARLPDSVPWRETTAGCQNTILLVADGSGEYGKNYEWQGNEPKLMDRDPKEDKIWTWKDFEWDCRVIDAQEQFQVQSRKRSWVDYIGMWGRRAGTEGESGPPGPKWDTPAYHDDNPFEKHVDPRLRWGRDDDLGFDWMDTLLFEMAHDETVSLEARRHALKALTDDRQLDPQSDRRLAADTARQS